jgi:hypothetical protein
MTKESTMAVTLTQALDVAYWTRDDFNNWKRRVGFSTRMPETSPGVTQMLSRDNVLEIALLAAASEFRVEPAYAKYRVEHWLREEKRGTLPAAFAVNPQSLEAYAAYGLPVRSFAKAEVGKLALKLPDIQPKHEQRFKKREPRPATVLMLIDLAEIVRRVDALFEKEEG